MNASRDFKKEYDAFLKKVPYQTAVVDGVEVRYQYGGKDGAPVILFFNGLEMQEMWMPYAEKLGKEYRFLIYEYPFYTTKAWIVDGDIEHEIATFGPLAVEPTWEGNDIGGALMRETIKLAKKHGIAGIVIIGEPHYYPRFGFERASKYKITDARGKSFDEIMVLPLNNDFSLMKGKLTESSDFEKLGDEAALLRISEEFPKYRKVKVKDGFMQIFEQHLGVVESVENDIYNVRYWEKLIPAKLAGDINEIPKPGNDVKFQWNHRGESEITMVFKNLLEE